MLGRGLGGICECLGEEIGKLGTSISGVVTSATSIVSIGDICTSGAVQLCFKGDAFAATSSFLKSTGSVVYKSSAFSGKNPRCWMGSTSVFFKMLRLGLALRFGDFLKLELSFPSSEPSSAFIKTE